MVGIALTLLAAAQPSYSHAPVREEQTPAICPAPPPQCAEPAKDPAAAREQKKSELQQKLRGLEGKHGGQCVVFVQRITGIHNNCAAHDCARHPFRGRADRIPPNTTTPDIGAAVLLRAGAYGHVALVIDIQGDDLILAESNYRLDERITIGRRVSTTDPLIRGYFVFD